MEFNPIPWKIIDLYFKDNPSALVKHHLQSYNDFFNKGLPQLIKEKNPKNSKTLKEISKNQHAEANYEEFLV